MEGKAKVEVHSMICRDYGFMFAWRWVEIMISRIIMITSFSEDYRKSGSSAGV